MNIFSFCLKLVHIFIHLQHFVFNVLWKAAQPLKLTHTFLLQNRLLKLQPKELNKVPVHLALVVHEDVISFDDIAQLVMWCLTYKISHISVYDLKGEVKSNEALLKTSIKQHKGIISKPDMQQQQKSMYILSFCDDADDGSMMEKQQCSSSQLYLFSPEDGRDHLVSTSQLLAKNVKAGRCTLQQITPTYVDNIIQGDNGTPDPDMCIRFGKTESMLGFLPWQMRLTEIFSLPSHHGIDMVSFQEVLHKFSCTKQRFGK